MKKIVTLLSAIGMMMQLSADGKHDGVVALPHLMKIVIADSDALKIDSQQQKQLDGIMATAPQKIHTLMDEAAELEQKIKRGVLKDKKSFDESKNDLDKLAQLEYALSKEQINAIGEVQKILTKEQYQMVLKKLMQAKGK